MGTWGPGIFDDDVAMDIKVMFEGDIARGYSVSEATAHVLRDPPWGFDDEEDTAVTFLALASLQLEHDALQQDIRERAIQAIDSGVLLWRWEESVEEQGAERIAALEAFKQRLPGANTQSGLNSSSGRRRSLDYSPTHSTDTLKNAP